MLGRLACLLLGAVAVTQLTPACAESPSGDEFPFWPASVKWNPKLPFKTCSPTDSATPHGPATWDAKFTSCVYTLAYFDTCADDSCVDAFSASTKTALNCSYDGKIGTAQEIEAYRLERCAAARKVDSDRRYVPESSPLAPPCTSAQLATWDATYSTNQDYNGCVKALTTTTSTRACSEYCRRVFHDAVSDAGECLFSAQAGTITHHEWLKYLLVWCIDARGENIRTDPLLFAKGTSSPVPTTPKPTKTTPAPTTAIPSESSSGSEDAGEPVDNKKNTSMPTIEPSSSGSEGSEVSDSSGPPIDLASSQEEETTQTPIQSPPQPRTPDYGRASISSSVRLHAIAVVVSIASMALV